MKRIQTILLSILFSIFVFPSAMAQDAYFFHLKNGEVRVFYTDWVESMSFSKIDADGNEQDFICSHEVQTNDTVYRFPINEIDSVCFTSPKTEYQTGVK